MKKRKRLTPEQRAGILDDYSKGILLKHIAAKYSIAESCISMLALRCQLKTRRQGRSKGLQQGYLQKLIDDYQKGMLIKQIAYKYQITYNRVFIELHKAKVQLNRGYGNGRSD